MNSVRLVGVLDDPAEIHHGDAVADVLDHRQVVRDEQVRQAELALQVHQQVDDLRLDRHVERGDRLVADDQLRVERQRPRDADALPLAAGELVRDSGSSARARSPTRSNSCGDPLLALARRCAMPWITSGSPTMSPARHARVERGERVLEDDLHLRGGSGRSSALPRLRDVLCRRAAIDAGRSARSGAARCGRPWICRSPIRRPGPASRPRAMAKLTPSTACTWPTGAPQQPLADREMLLQVRRPRAPAACGGAAAATLHRAVSMAEP